MKKNISKILLLCFVFLILSSVAIIPINSASAGTLWDKQADKTKLGTPFGDTGDPEDPRAIIADILIIFLTFLAIIFVALIIFAGYTWMTASGNEEQIKKAKSQIKAAVIGLVIILASYGITVFMFDPIRKAVTGSIW